MTLTSLVLGIVTTTAQITTAQAAPLPIEIPLVFTALEAPRTSELPEVPQPPPLDIPSLIDHVATLRGISKTTLTNLVASESDFNPNAVGDHGCSYGLTQQNTCTTTVTKEEALDPETALTIAAKDIKNGTQDRYTVCNCYSWVKTKIKNLPLMNKITPNSTPRPGTVAIFWYGNVEHLAYVTAITKDGIEISEANYSPCKIGKRVIQLTDPRLVGFWIPDPQLISQGPQGP